MRNYTEPTLRNLLRKPLVLGVSSTGLILLAFLVLGLSIGTGSSPYGNVASILVATLGYGALRAASVFAKTGWEERALFRIERHLGREKERKCLALRDSAIEVSSPDTLDPDDLIRIKESLRDKINGLGPQENWRLVFRVNLDGALVREAYGEFGARLPQDIDSVVASVVGQRGKFVYSLHQLPVATDPLWLSAVVSTLRPPATVLISVKGTDFHSSKRQIERSRKRNARDDARISDIDSEVAFEEASHLLSGLSRGDERVVEFSLVIVSSRKLELDQELFCQEKEPRLPVLSALGARARSHRSHLVRSVTAADLIPSFLDPKESGPQILTTRRGLPLYFSPQDPRLEALHWLVVGASGSGKSFLTGLVLRRMIQAGTSMSVLFVDHNRSFRRLVRWDRGVYLEPEGLLDLSEQAPNALSGLDRPGSMVGIELSDLSIDEKKEATHFLLSRVEQFLRDRDSTHPVYVVLDECWNFMRDEPVLVQRAFREFRKLNGAAIAITQSLSDFLTDQSGQSIFQNAPIRILLRQGEDVSQYQGILGFNNAEARRVRLLKQSKGEYSECLIKTPFLSRIGRLCPTEEEHDLLRTDNIREELIREQRERRGE